MHILERRHGHGVRLVYGYPGDVTDPEVPPLPPHITFEQAKNLAGALAQGDAARGQIIRQAVKGKLQEFVNR